MGATRVPATHFVRSRRAGTTSSSATQAEMHLLRRDRQSPSRRSKPHLVAEGSSGAGARCGPDLGVPCCCTCLTGGSSCRGADPGPGIGGLGLIGGRGGTARTGKDAILSCTARSAVRLRPPGSVLRKLQARIAGPDSRSRDAAGCGLTIMPPTRKSDGCSAPHRPWTCTGTPSPETWGCPGQARPSPVHDHVALNGHIAEHAPPALRDVLHALKRRPASGAGSAGAPVDW